MIAPDGLITAPSVDGLLLTILGFVCCYSPPVLIIKYSGFLLPKDLSRCTSRITQSSTAIFLCQVGTELQCIYLRSSAEHKLEKVNEDNSRVRYWNVSNPLHGPSCSTICANSRWSFIEQTRRRDDMSLSHSLAFMKQFCERKKAMLGCRLCTK